VVKTVEAWINETGRLEEVKGYDFARMEPGNALVGPAIVWTPITTLVAAPGQTVAVDEYKNLVIRGHAAGDRELGAATSEIGIR
jgi:N-methylhydantoinase A/oxoprolinase/acetone carboxylase beta subunit